MNSRFFLCLIFFAVSFSTTYSQDRQVKKDSKTKSHVYILTSKLAEGRGDNGRWSSYGFGYDLDWKLNNNWNIGLRTNVRSWSDRDKFLLPANLGIGHSFYFGNRVSMDAFVGAGPSLVIGNDYAGIFAHLNSGVRFNILKLGSKELFTGLYFSQAMAFHPSPFEHLDIVFGIRL
jgi:hypothetical protein